MGSPFYMPSGYSNPYGQSIAELMLRQGDVAAQRAGQSGAIWGSALANVGNLVAGAVQQHQAKKDAQKQRAMFDQALASWDPTDVQGSYRRFAAAAGPKLAMEFVSGLSQLEDMQRKAQKGETPTPEQWKASVTALAAGEKARPGFIAQHGANLAPLFKAGAKAYGGIDIPDAPTPEFLQDLTKQVVSVYDQMSGAKVGTREIKTRDAQGNEVTQIVEDKPGQTFAAPAPKPEKPTLETFGGAVWERDPVTGKRTKLGASEGALNREASAAVRAETQAEKEKKALEAKSATDEQVDSAFAAMKDALKNVKSYAGVKAATSPLEAANARQQYLAAANAFAATLSRATGDTRISDFDRRAYAKLLTYTGPGSSLLMIARPDLVETRLKEAENFFSEASKARRGTSGGNPNINLTRGETDILARHSTEE